LNPELTRLVRDLGEERGAAFPGRDLESRPRGIEGPHPVGGVWERGQEGEQLRFSQDEHRRSRYDNSGFDRATIPR
jgi:hypothetical protein